MADTPEVLRELQKTAYQPDTHLPVLVPNMRGLDNLLKLEETLKGDRRLTDEIAVFVPASDVSTLIYIGSM